MPVPTNITDLSTTAVSNFPQGTELPSTIDDTLRAHASFIAKIHTGAEQIVPVAQLLATNGGGVLSVSPPGTGSVSVTLAYAMRYRPTALDKMTTAQRDDVLSGTGAIDVTTPIIAARTENKKLIFPYGKYKLSGADPLAISANSHWDMDGCEFVHSTGTQSTIKADNVDDWGIYGAFQITGPGGTSGIANAVFVKAGNRWRIENPTFRNIQGTGLYIEGGTPSGALRGDQGHVLNLIARDCYIGSEVEVGAGAEYCHLVNPNIGGCLVALRIKGGNVVVLGGNIVDNVDGVWLTAGSNHGHGTFVGTNINHNTQYNIRSHDTTNGHSFGDCHIYSNGSGAGAIYLQNSKGVIFDGGHMDCWIYNDSGVLSSYNYAMNMYCPGGYGAVNLTDTGAGKNQFIFRNCAGPGAFASGISINDPADVYVHARRVAASTQVLTSGVGTTLIFPSVQINGDRRLAYNSVTGIFTVPANMAGQYRIHGNLIFGGTALNLNASYAEVAISSEAPRLATLSAFSTTIISADFDTTSYLNAGDTVRVNGSITGTSPTFGQSTYLSTLTIERVG
jgi:hypothetical protein